MYIQNRIEYILFISFVRFFNLIGFERARRSAKIIAFIIFYFIPIRKSTVISNLKTAFPEYSEKEINKLAFRSYISFSITLSEIFCLPYISREKLKSQMDCPQIDFVREVYNKGKGMLIMTAHFGNWELCATAIGAQLDLPVYVVAKNQRNPFVTKWLNMMRESFGNKVTPLGVSIKNVYKELLNKNILGIVGDQRGPREGIRVNFFGKSTSVYPGAAFLAVKTGSPIVVSINPRLENFKYKVFTEFIDPKMLTGTDEEKILEINQKYFSILESTIRKYPDQWFWMHKIWKY
ncbi:MAG: lysophospholipid acyltransferase family protein [Ignavibacteriales bacterium]|nr:lysophospholipid acyltransferase family protein [Ignavibacteriales bacterium]